jgi:hypothetical protein
VRAIEFGPQVLGPPIERGDPRAELERGPVADVLGMAADEIGDPFAFGIAVESDDLAEHGWSDRPGGAGVVFEGGDAILASLRRPGGGEAGGDPGPAPRTMTAGGR